MWRDSSTCSPEYNSFTTHSHGVDSLFPAAYPMPFGRLCAGQISYFSTVCVHVCLHNVILENCPMSVLQRVRLNNSHGIPTWK